jgi:integrase/recombinase XerD
MTRRDLVEGLDDHPMSDTSPLPVLPAVASRLLTAEQFQRLADVPPEIEWFANLGNKATRRAYENALGDFMKFTGIAKPEEFRTVTRAHVIAWRDDLVQRALSGMTVRHRLAALSSLFESLCEKNAVTHNPVKGVKRPPVESYEGKTPALGDHQARKLLDAPDGVSLKGKRDRALLATLLYHALRREELCRLKVKDFKHERRGVPHLKVFGKGGKIRYVPLHPAASGLIGDYLEVAGHGADDAGALFRPLRNNCTWHTGKSDHARRGLQTGAAILNGAGFRDRGARVAGDRRDQRARSPGRHRQGAGVAGSRQHRHHANLRSPQDQAGGQSDLQGRLLENARVLCQSGPATGFLLLISAATSCRRGIASASGKASGSRQA